MSEAKKPTTRKITPEEMAKQIARFSKVKPQSDYYRRDQGIPDEAYTTVTAKTLYTLMAPST